MFVESSFHNDFFEETDGEVESGFYYFDNFCFGAKRKMLFFNGETVELGSRASHLLLILLKGCGKVQLKKNLLKAVWGTVVVEECNLRAQIYQIRRALSKGKNQRDILTVPGYGYMFVGSVWVCDC
ncbi:hypothetical protein GIW42_29530, partial [Pseudomonas sp. PA-6-1H]